MAKRGPRAIRAHCLLRLGPQAVVLGHPLPSYATFIFEHPMAAVCTSGRLVAPPCAQRTLQKASRIAGTPLTQRASSSAAPRPAFLHRAVIAASASPSGFATYGPSGGELLDMLGPCRAWAAAASAALPIAHPQGPRGGPTALAAALTRPVGQIQMPRPVAGLDPDRLPPPRRSSGGKPAAVANQLLCFCRCAGDAAIKVIGCGESATSCWALANLPCLHIPRFLTFGLIHALLSTHILAQAVVAATQSTA